MNLYGGCAGVVLEHLAPLPSSPISSSLCGCRGNREQWELSGFKGGGGGGD